MCVEVGEHVVIVLTCLFIIYCIIIAYRQFCMSDNKVWTTQFYWRWRLAYCNFSVFKKHLSFNVPLIPFSSDPHVLYSYFQWSPCLMPTNSMKLWSSKLSVPLITCPHCLPKPYETTLKLSIEVTFHVGLFWSFALTMISFQVLDCNFIIAAWSLIVICCFVYLVLELDKTFAALKFLKWNAWVGPSQGRLRRRE